MTIFGVDYGGDGERWRHLLPDLVLKALCRWFRVHSNNCRGLLDHDPNIGRWL